MLLDMVPTYRDYDPEVQSTTPMVSVFFPVINAIDSIEKTINSVLNQSYRDFDIIICDFGSTDGTKEFLTDTYGENSRIKILEEENIGIAAASNICINNASGMYLLQLETGDQLELYAIENLLSVIDSSPSNSCVYGNSPDDDSDTDKFSRMDLLSQMVVGKPRLFRKRDWSRVNGFSEVYHLAYNHDFFLKLSEVGEFVQVNNRLFSSSGHTLHASLDGFNQDLEETKRVVQQALSRQGISEWEVHIRNFLTGKIGITLTKKGNNLSSLGPFLSVVIITRNRAELLSDAVRSTLNQSYENFELIVIDDGSTDDTVLTIQSFNDARIRLISTKQSGIPKSRNLGVRMAKGEYVVIMDDDDLMLPHRLQDQINCLTPGSAGSYGGWVDQNSEMEHEYYPGAPHGYSEILFGGKVMLHPASMIKRDILLEFPYDENYSFGTDYVMNLEIARAGHRLNHTGSYILLRRFHGGNVTITNAGEQKNTARVRVKEFLQELDEETEKKMRAEWKSRKHFNGTPRPTPIDFDLFFPWLNAQDTKLNQSIEQVVAFQNSLNKGVDNYSVEKRWKQKGDVLFFHSGQRDISFRMPKGWKIRNTHPDLFRISHYYLCSPWEGGILDGWIPSREKGWRPGLAFSGGVDSTACMALMPPETLLFYHQREGFESNLDHSNAFRFIDKLRADGKQVVVTESDHERIREDFGKSPGFSTDLAGAVHVILLADFFELGAVAMGMPL
ncbi:MAG: glycosyltransferase family 2 protein, partial [Candidatus Poseidoniaceae archaeon]